MQYKKKILISLAICVLIVFSPGAISKADVDRIIDFNSTLKDFDLDVIHETGRQPVTDKIILLIGTMSMIYPLEAFACLYQPEEVINQAAFIQKFKNPDDNVTRFLVQTLSSKIQRALAGSSPEKVVGGIISAINGHIRRNSLFSPEILGTETIPAFAAPYLAMELEEDEEAFLNRLLLDSIYKNIVSPVTVSIEIVKGEWLGYEKVNSYLGFIQFTGPDCFPIFKRRRPESSSPAMIPQHTRILVATIPKKIIKSQVTGREAWLFEGLFIREID